MKLLILALLVMLMVECLGKEQKSKGSKKVDSTKKDGPGEDAKKTDSAKKDDSKDTKKPSKEKKRKGKHFWFDGKDQWGKQQLDLCFKQTQLPNDYFCYMYYRNYEPVYIDPVTLHPIIIIYRKFIPRKFIDEFLHDLDQRQRFNKENGIDEEGFMKNYLKTYKRRKANATTIPHKFGKGVARVFRRAQALIPMLNFSLSGPWEVTSYREGGHHAAHYDFITYSSPDQYSKKTREYGNRFVTFALTLKAATWGGETTFVFLNHTVSLSPGDVLLFTNMRKDMTLASGSVHAECPVEKGEKITATLWLRPKGQEFFNSQMQDDHLSEFDIEKLIAPNMQFYGMSPFYDMYAFQQMMMEEFARRYAAEQEQSQGK